MMFFQRLANNTDLSNAKRALVAVDCRQSDSLQLCLVSLLRDWSYKGIQVILIN